MRPTYSTDVIIDPADKGLAKLESAVDKLAQSELGRSSDMLAYPCIKDGDKKANNPSGKAYAGKKFISLWKLEEQGQIPLFDAEGKPIAPADPNAKNLFYAGAVVRVAVQTYAYTKGAGGIGLGVVAIRFARDGERLGGGIDPMAAMAMDEDFDAGDDDLGF